MRVDIAQCSEQGSHVALHLRRSHHWEVVLTHRERERVCVGGGGELFIYSYTRAFTFKLALYVDTIYEDCYVWSTCANIHISYNMNSSHLHIIYS